ncbi:thiol-disulfide oxidoreductase ResA [Bacillus infantis]|uniref:thiol-disulfide oxidoreductase ResA n=1 Tax=Bacillus infantis TaxID=324767 RepID=UPI002003141C|nr:thiol-disulfide oxidoreductase ResA [Bacillus infantis]MCK6205718.1 thiol-disulfide oxidoreductase ResA [Bacillus infantis]
MKRKRLVLRTGILLLLLAAVGYTLYANFTKDDTTIKVGSSAPDFVLETLDGKEMKLSDLKGKGVFLNFWGTWCKPCEKEMPYMETEYQNFKDKNIEILAVNISESNLVVSSFVERHNLTFPILMDRKSQVTDVYKIGPIPTTYLIDEKGKIQKVITGAMTQGDVREHLNSIVPK